MNIKTKIITALTLAILVVPGISLAQTMSVAQLQAEIQSLTAQLTQLEAQLAASGGTTTWCYTFNNNLSIGMSGNAVTELQTALQKDGESVTITGTFDDQTASAVTAFQEKYQSQILSPYGLSYGTGYAGKSTRAELNSLFGCTGSNPVTPPITVCPAWGCNGPQPIVPPVTIPTSTTSGSATINYFYAMPSNVSSGQTTSLTFSVTGSTLSQLKVILTCPAGTSAALGECYTPPTFAANANGYGLGVINTTGVSQQMIATLVGYDASGNVLVSQATPITILPAGAATSPTSSTNAFGISSMGGTSVMFTNSTQSLLGSFTITSPVATTLNSVLVKTNSNIGSGQLSLANLRVYVTTLANVAQGLPPTQWYGATQAVVSPNNTYTFSGSYPIAANTSAAIEVFGDTASAAQGNYTSPISIAGATGSSASVQSLTNVSGGNVYVELPTTATFNESANTINSGNSVTFSWTNAAAAQGLMNDFGSTSCVSGLTMYDVTNNQSFICGDVSRPIPTSGSDTITFTNTTNSPLSIQFGLDYGSNQPLYQAVTVNPPLISSTQGSLTLTSPNGGQVWHPGETHQVTWNATGLQSVQIYLYNSAVTNSGGTNYITPNNASIPASQGYYNWTIPALTSLPTGASTNYRIDLVGFPAGVTDPSGSGVLYATSSAPFTIASAPVTTQSAPVVTVSANPTTITLGQSSTITWSATNAVVCSPAGSWFGAANLPTSSPSLGNVAGSASITPSIAGTYTYNVYCGNSNGLSTNGSATLTVTAPTTATTYNGTLNVSLDSSTPAPTVVAPGDNSIVFAQLRLSAVGGNVNAQWFSVVSNSANAVSGLSNIRIFNGATLLGTASKLQANPSVPGGYVNVPESIPVTLTSGSSVVLTLVADVSPSATGIVNLGIGGGGGNYATMSPNYSVYGNNMTISAVGAAG
jgi:hypothetical protein